jgi:putative transposase
MSPSPRIPKGDTEGVYFVTFTVVEWINIFTKPIYFQILADSLQYCIEHKGLLLYEYVFMTNHIHLIVGADEGSKGLDSIIRDFKGYTSRKIRKNLEEHESRTYIIRLIKQAKKIKEEKFFHIWQETNYPESIESDSFLEQKVTYIQQNPVKKRYVLNPEDWLYGSAKQKILDLPDDHPDVMIPCKHWFE